MRRAQAPDTLMTLDEYFAFEEGSELRHEYVHGRLHVMLGVTQAHSRIVGNIVYKLWPVARTGRCRVHHGDFMVKVGNVIYYPDVMIACGCVPGDIRLEDAPSVIVEVLSPSTERTDRGEKTMVYHRIPTLETYLVVEQDRRLVDRHWRDESRGWQREAIVETGSVSIPIVELPLTLDEIYDGVEIPSPDERARLRRLREEELVYG
jgi:Uma2 family endonuclease